jgi:hypothetical protein
MIRAHPCRKVHIVVMHRLYFPQLLHFFLNFVAIHCSIEVSFRRNSCNISHVKHIHLKAKAIITEPTCNLFTYASKTTWNMRTSITILLWFQTHVSSGSVQSTQCDASAKFVPKTRAQSHLASGSIDCTPSFRNWITFAYYHCGCDTHLLQTPKRKYSLGENRLLPH